MVESLLTPSSVKLFGRQLNELYLLAMDLANAGAGLTAQKASDAAAAGGSTPATVLAAVMDFVSTYSFPDPDGRVGGVGVLNAVKDAVAAPSATAASVASAAQTKASTYDVAYPPLGRNGFLRAQLETA